MGSLPGLPSPPPPPPPPIGGIGGGIGGGSGGGPPPPIPPPPPPIMPAPEEEDDCGAELIVIEPDVSPLCDAVVAALPTELEFPALRVLEVD